MRKLIFPFFMLSGCMLCIGSMAYSLTSGVLASNNFLSSTTTIENILYQPIIAALTGAVLTGGSFFFLLKRMVYQYDLRHDRTETEMKDLSDQIHNLESDLTVKLYEQSENLSWEIHNNLTSTTNMIIANLDTFRETIQDLVVDSSSFKAVHSKCDYNSGDIKVLKSQIENMSKTK